MIKLSETQRAILTAAAQRADLSVLPLPDNIKLKGGALKQVMDSLIKRGLIRVIQTDPDRIVITSEGMAAIGVEPQHETAAAPGDAGAQPTLRAGTKQALVVDMLRRPEGATVDQIAAATGWQKHTVRGAISGTLKKKLGFNVEATRVRNIGPNKTGAKGSATVYRILQL